MGRLTSDDPVFATYASAASLMILLAVATAWITVVQVLRHHLENIPFFLGIGLLFVLTGQIHDIVATFWTIGSLIIIVMYVPVLRADLRFGQAVRNLRSMRNRNAGAGGNVVNGRILLLLAVALAIPAIGQAQESRGTGENRTFSVKCDHTFYRYSGEITAHPLITLSRGTIRVRMEADVKEIERVDPGGLATVEWQIELSNIKAFTNVRAYFNTGIAEFRVEDTVDMPGYSSNFSRIEVDYDWCGNQRTLEFVDFSFEPGASAPISQGGAILLKGALLPKRPTQTPGELAGQKESEARAVRHDSETKRNEASRLEGEASTSLIEATSIGNRLLAAFREGAPDAERERLKAQMNAAQDRSEALTRQHDDLIKEADRLSRQADTLESAAATLRKQ